MRRVCDDTENKVYHSEYTVAAQLKAMHPAVLLRYYRLRSAARLAARQPMDVLITLYAARKAKRSWIGALETDLKWLAESTLVFAEFLPLDGQRVAAYFKLCSHTSIVWIASV